MACMDVVCLLETKRVKKIEEQIKCLKKCSIYFNLYPEFQPIRREEQSKMPQMLNKSWKLVLIVSMCKKVST